MSGIRHWLPIFVQAKGFYLLPAVGATLVALRYFLSRTGRERPLRLLSPALAATAAFSILVYFNFFNFHYGGFVNPYEFFHYYLGSKYAPEIGYFDIYNAALVADAETGQAFAPSDGLISDLRTYGYRDLREVLGEADLYRSRFTPERWREWVVDVAYFKSRLRGNWNDVLRDKGYNATPVWTMLVGGALSGSVSTRSGAGMAFLALLDVALLAGAVVCVRWAFGTWPALLSVVFLASSYLMAHVHMKGAFLRTDFVVALVAAMCLLARGRHGLAGALVGYASLARIFPAIFLFGPGVKLASELVPVGREASRQILARHGRGPRGAAVGAGLVVLHAVAAGILLRSGWGLAGEGIRETLSAQIGPGERLFLVALVPATVALAAATLTVWGTRRKLLDSRHARFFGAFALTTIALVGATVVHSRGTEGWEGFARKMALHRTTYNHWNIGVTSVVIARFDPAGSGAEALAARPPFAREWRGNAWFSPESVQDRAWTIRLLQVLALAAAWFAARKVEDPHAFALGFVPTFFLTAPTYYYYIILLLPFLYFASHPDRLRGTLGVAFLFIYGALGFAFYFRWDQYFTTYYWNSVLALGLAVAMTAAAFGRFDPWGPVEPTRPAGRGRRR